MEVPGVLDPRFSSPGSPATSWSDVEQVLGDSGIYWLTTVRREGQPHSTPLAALYENGSIYFATGEQEQKTRNLDQNPSCTLVTGSSDFWSGLDVVIEGRVSRVTDKDSLVKLVSALEHKYRGFFGFTPGDGVIVNGGGGEALVFRMEPRKILAFARGDSFSQTRWTVKPQATARA